LGDQSFDSRRGGPQGRPPQGRDDRRMSSGPYLGSGGRNAGAGRPRGSMEKEAAVAAARNITGGASSSSSRNMGSRNQSRDSSREGRVTSVERKPPAAAPPSAPASAAGGARKRLSEDELRKQAKLILDEYLQSLDMKVCRDDLDIVCAVVLLKKIINNSLAYVVYAGGNAMSSGAGYSGVAVHSSLAGDHGVSREIAYCATARWADTQHCRAISNHSRIAVYSRVR
jgi:hypothetical protein